MTFSFHGKTTAYAGPFLLNPWKRSLPLHQWPLWTSRHSSHACLGATPAIFKMPFPSILLFSRNSPPPSLLALLNANEHPSQETLPFPDPTISQHPLLTSFPSLSTLTKVGYISLPCISFASGESPSLVNPTSCLCHACTEVHSWMRSMIWADDVLNSLS